MKRILYSAVTMSVLGMASVHAEDNSAILAQINERLMKLEAENRALKAEIEQIKHPHSKTVHVAKKKKTVKQAPKVKQSSAAHKAETPPPHKAPAPHITIIDQKSPKFILGKQTHINMKLIPEDAPKMWFKAGVRIQGTLEAKNTDFADPGKLDTDINDAYLRRVRFEVAAGFGEHTSFVMDVRNDKSNYGIENTEGQFSVGDAYLKIKKPFDNSLVNFKLYRAKIDVSRTETVKSARVINYDRPYVADYAAQFISFNRRGANVQMYGDWEKKIHYQIAAGSASSPDKVLDAAGIKGSKANVDIEKQSFFYGGKVVLSPFDGWEEKHKTETYFGVGKHFSVGAGYWVVPEIKGTAEVGSNTADFDLKRTLLNVEASMHYYGLFLQSEYFRFDDVVKSWNVQGDVETGTSEGWYITGEYVFPELYYIAPYFRYESWDRFTDADGYNVTSKTAGVNWYLRGNTTKVGMLYQKDAYGLHTGNKEEDIFRITSQWFF